MAQNVLANNLANMNDPNQTSDNPLTTGLKSLGTQGNNSGDTPVFKTPDKFSYDASSDPQYQSALNLARQNIQTDQGNTLANLVSHGQGNSSYSAGAVQGVADKAMGNLNNNLLPQFIQQAYNHYQDGIKNDYQTQLANYNASQDKIKNGQWDQTFNAGRTDAANNLAVNKGTLTGDYTSPENASLQKQMDANSSAYATATPEQQAQLHEQNLAIAKQLGKTYDPSTGEYSGGTTTRTIVGQNLDQNKQQSHIDLAQKLSEEYGVKVEPKNDPALAYKQVEGLTPVSALQRVFDNKIKQETVNNSATATSNSFKLGNRNADISAENVKADNTRQDNAVNLSTNQRKFAGDVQNELGQAKSRDDVVKFFNANAGEITSQLGSDAFTKMKNDAFAQYDKVTPSDKQDTTSREKAIAAAQKDTRWDMPKTDKNALISEYETYYK
jgi:hypothetical protein